VSPQIAVPMDRHELSVSHLQRRHEVKVHETG
jgi:hypothetical protein